MEKRRNARAGETGYPRENPPEKTRRLEAYLCTNSSVKHTVGRRCKTVINNSKTKLTEDTLRGRRSWPWRKGGGNEVPKKTRRPEASANTIPTFENPRATQAEIEPDSPRWDMHRVGRGTANTKGQVDCACVWQCGDVSEDGTGSRRKSVGHANCQPQRLDQPPQSHFPTHLSCGHYLPRRTGPEGCAVRITPAFHYGCYLGGWRWAQRTSRVKGGGEADVASATGRVLRGGWLQGSYWSHAGRRHTHQAMRTTRVPMCPARCSSHDVTLQGRAETGPGERPAGGFYRNASPCDAAARSRKARAPVHVCVYVCVRASFRGGRPRDRALNEGTCHPVRGHFAGLICACEGILLGLLEDSEAQQWEAKHMA
ncbi:hypothetical protein PR048_006317 [Dryococelus australis]|uniref:Uncharacterized protein n=1 Tax=Dryococelus australis TaxID=614101 RepID=A0ABQ9IAM8_9NEOP|nr:hypothetical protein PR048_006317 [Dryococelus australis]